MYNIPLAGMCKNPYTKWWHLSSTWCHFWHCHFITLESTWVRWK